MSLRTHKSEVLIVEKPDEVRASADRHAAHTRDWWRSLTDADRQRMLAIINHTYKARELEMMSHLALDRVMELEFADDRQALADLEEEDLRIERLAHLKERKRMAARMRLLAICIAVLTGLLCASLARGQTFTANDYVCFQDRYAAGDMRADCDGSGALTPNDFLCFVNRFAERDPWADCDGGWTVFAEPAMTIHAAANGNDTHPGTLALPKRTLTAAYAAAPAGQVVHILLRCGDTFSEAIQLYKGSGRSQVAEYMVIGSYGSGPRPKIRSTQTPFNGDTGTVNGLAIIDLDIAPAGTPTIGNNGIWLRDGNKNILIEGCRISGFPVNLASHAVGSGRIDNLRIRRNVIVDSYGAIPAHSQNVFLGEQFGLVIEENIIDKAGRNGEQTIFRHNVYIHDNNAGTARFAGNITARACATGVQQRPGGDSKNNLLLQNPVGHTWGGNGVFSYNVNIDGRDISAEHTRGIAYALGGSGTVEYNIAAYQVSGTENITAFSMESFNSGILRGNYVYDWRAPLGQCWATAVQWDGGAGSVTVTGNTFLMPGNGMLIRHETRALSGQFTYSHNTYYTSTPPGGCGGYLPFSTASGAGRDWNAWRLSAGEKGSVYLSSPPANPGATVAAYLQSLAINPGADAIETFMAEARQQSKQNWRPAFTAAVFNGFVRGRIQRPAGMLVHP